MRKEFIFYTIFLILTFSFVKSEDGLIEIPVTFIDGLVYVQPVTTKGDTLTFLTDTGGSLLIYSDPVDSLGLKRVSAAMQGMPVEAAFLPSFKKKAWIPSPLFTNKMLKIKETASIPPHSAMMPEHDGILGQAWFADRIFTFDYPSQRAWLRPHGNLPEHDKTEIIQLGLKSSSGEMRENYFPRIEVNIDGKSYPMLLQTGGAIILSEEVTKKNHNEKIQVLSTGFISETIFQEWRAEYPGWQVIEEADHFYGSAMIRVPEISLGSVTVGPAWFTKRRDFAYKEWISRYTDEPVVGAVGGNALQDLRITLDYINGKAIVQRPEG